MSISIINREDNVWSLKCEVCGCTPETVYTVADSETETYVCKEHADMLVDDSSNVMNVVDALEFVMSDECKPILYNRQLEGYSWEEIRQDICLSILEGKNQVYKDKPHTAVKFAALNVTRKEIRRRRRFHFAPLQPKLEGVIRFAQLGKARFASMDSVDYRLDREYFLETLTEEQRFVFVNVLEEGMTWAEASRILGKRVDRIVKKVKALWVEFFTE